MSLPQPDPSFAIINLATGEIIDLATFAREYVSSHRPSPARQREILRQAVGRAMAKPTLPCSGDALAALFFAPPPEDGN